MIFYDFGAPSPRRVRIFLAEKGISIPTVTIDLGKGEQFTADYRAKNPRCTVPTLELDNGRCLWDTLAICEYLEALYPQPPLLGTTPLDRAHVLMWYQRIEFEGFMSVADVLRNASPAFKGHSLTGPRPSEQIPALVERGRSHMQQFYQDMNARLAESANVAGDFFSLADIQLLCVLDFATGWGRMPIPEAMGNLIAWREKTSSRSSTKT